MNKKFIISFFVVLLLGLMNVVATDLSGLSLSPSSATISGNPGDSKSTQIIVTNNIGTSLTNLNIVKVDLVGINDATKKISLSGVSVTPTLFNIANGGSQTLTISVAIPTGIPFDTYKGTFKITDNSVDATKNFDVIVSVSSKDDFEILTFTDSTPLEITGQEDSTVTGTFSVKNIGSTTLTFNTQSFDITQIDLSDDDRIIALSFPVVSVNPGETKPITITANIPNNVAVDTYDGIMTVKSGTDSETFKLEIKVHPELCKDGPIGELTIDVEEPNNGDEFAPGELMEIRVNVDNNHDKDLDVKVEAFLYNVDQDDKIEEVETEEDEVKEDDDKDFEMQLEIPTEDIDTDDEYVLFVKAFEDGNEEDHCAESQVDVDIERESHEVLVNSVTVSPSPIVQQGDSVDISVKVVNVGKENEDDVTVKISIPELRIDQTSQPFDLDDGESNNNDQIVTFRNLKVPVDANDKAYSIEATVTFDDGDEDRSGFGELTVMKGEVSGPVVPTEVLRLQSTSETGAGVFSISAIVTNSESSNKAYTIDVRADWAQSISPQIASLAASESKVLQFTLIAVDGLDSGSYSGTVTVRGDGNVIDSEVFTVSVTGVEEEPSGITGFSVFEGVSGSTVLFIIGDIVLIIVAIFFIRLIFTSGKKKDSQPKIEKVKL
ncbi:MAG: putative S-layer protein [Nanoarchaeota archaeon]